MASLIWSTANDLSMNLTELKKKTIAELLAIAKEMGLDNMARSRKQDIIFAILKTHARNGEAIYGDGVLEVLPDGFGDDRIEKEESEEGQEDHDDVGQPESVDLQ